MNVKNLVSEANHDVACVVLNLQYNVAGVLILLCITKVLKF